MSIERRGRMDKILPIPSEGSDHILYSVLGLIAKRRLWYNNVMFWL